MLETFGGGEPDGVDKLVVAIRKNVGVHAEMPLPAHGGRWASSSSRQMVLAEESMSRHRIDPHITSVHLNYYSANRNTTETSIGFARGDVFLWQTPRKHWQRGLALPSDRLPEFIRQFTMAVVWPSLALMVV